MHRRLILLVLVVLVSVTSACAAPRRYTATPLGTLGGSSGSAYGMNNAGAVVGWSSTSSNEARAFLWQNGAMGNLGTLGGDSSDAQDVNASGAVVGTSYKSDGQRHAFVYRNSHMDDIHQYGFASDAYGINDGGDVVGTVYDGGGDRHAYIWKDGQQTRIGPADARNGEARDISNTGWVTGFADCLDPVSQMRPTTAFLWRDEVWTWLTPLPGRDYAMSRGYAVNDSGQAVGYSDTTSSWRPCLWENGGVIDLGGFDDFSRGEAWGINNNRQVVGYATESGNEHAFMWQDDMMYDLNDLLDTPLDHRLSAGMAINDSGQIVACYSYTDGQNLFLLTPVPEPSSLLALGSGLLGLMGIVRRRK